MEWISVKSGLLPLNDDDQVLFVDFHYGRVVESYAGRYQDVKNFRKYQLENSYTHWIKLPSPPTKQ